MPRKQLFTNQGDSYCGSTQSLNSQQEAISTPDQLMSKPDYDSLWKEVIEDFLEEFLLFFAPDLYEQIDFKKGYQFKEKELKKLFPESQQKRLDKLVQVYLKNGEEKWILVHIEVQGYQEADFSERMFKYFYRTYDKYQKQIFAIAIFSDEYKSYQPNEYQYKFLDTELTYRYRTYKILEQKETELKKSRNIFAMAVLAGLYAIKSKKDMDIRYKFKVSLSRLLLEQKQSRKKIEDMFIFIDGILSLPKEQGLKFAAELNTILERGDEDMGLTWSKSNLAAVYREEGREEGIEIGIIKTARNMLKSGLSKSVIQQVTGLSPKVIEQLTRNHEGGS